MTPAPWHMLGDPLTCRLRHLKPGTPAFGRNLKEIAVMVEAAEREHRLAVAPAPMRKSKDPTLFASEAQGVRA
jgi:hypothetical protein